MAYCKVGDTVWAPLDGLERFRPEFRYIDTIFYKGQFYIMDHYGKFSIFDVRLPHPKVVELGIYPPQSFSYVQKCYLVDFGGELLAILREIAIFGELVESDEEDFDEADFDEGQQNNANEDEDNDQADGGGGGGGRKEEEEELFDDFDYENNYDRNIRSFINRTTHFEVFKLDMTSGLEPKWIDFKDLDGGALFAGFNQSFALSKSNLLGYQGDRTY
ncbi:hypothetical protein Vadar_020939 [Vaccinium darrowii]|uniref:Uncharacterized protein n=1 Tax=Vaccinium darrowii TaxID=229202 RepID=A0ACB7X2P9_9ERIC|nr:hypothetical protein Vadar_020939 [Vaccinium darrowii]